MTANSDKRYVGIYELDQGYGGPEEGGWYFMCGTLVKQVSCTEDEVEGVINHLKMAYPDEPGASVSSVLYRGGVYGCDVSESPLPEMFPESKPHYE